MDQSYFGEVDASSEQADSLNRQFVRDDLLNGLVGPNVPKGASIIVGLKGTGKTALGRVVSERFVGISWFRSEKSNDSRFDVPHTNLRSGVLMGMIRLFIIEQFVEYLLQEEKLSDQDLGVVFKFLKSASSQIAKATEVSLPFLKIKPSELFSSSNQKDVGADWASAIKLLSDNFQKENLLIVLDDIDTYFVGIEDHHRFIEGLCRAVIDINSILAPNISCILLLKQGIWRTMFENQEEYDKIIHHILFLKWDFINCLAVLCGRIAERHHKQINPITSFRDALPILKLEFAGPRATIEGCLKEIYAFSANGPRDILSLCNQIRYQHPTGKITEDMLNRALPDYSEQKLFALNGDYGHLYPGMPTFIQFAFQGFKAEFSGDDLIRHLEAGVLTDPKSQKQTFGGHNWYQDSTQAGLLKKLFDIGVVGVKRPGMPPLFANESSNMTANFIIKSDLVLHKAYRPALGF